ncbi:NAD(P)H-dependent glycerol-3-phosphate dehydrogenase [Campylobacter sp. MIT 12-8780]|uniref:NAD(P)H-dependent glycerol-3-phosphate dehydrogenase n=1 Tax=unclassified Campylobacter TaxID=2593542 RepID=UPI00115DA48F|nr:MULTISPECIES: NAD(P)H-dependent glycerol-3-phosphate dehydrogenase [unclassified Campylobacter]NDJ26492.1 NAD(P)H-dependent glycerol-3-phosphate dehydrogenase [Campylobacter sp. MIT 19-121]TQR43064.1 NAD(P)H-dependent glycerol-3-phosphate dehydrogenase [Campylobacter sp. MIT 12-8780]
MIAIIGAGKWGSALQDAFLQNQPCLISSPHTRTLPHFVSMAEALKCEYLVLALWAQGLEAWLKENFKDKGQKILLASKGIDTKSCKFLDELMAEYVSRDRICVLSGPSFAAEIMQKLPCALVVSGENEKLCKEFASFFPSYIKAYVDDDVRGAEICGAYKNVLAIASGISDGLKLGNNARASLIARGLVEMQRFGSFFGASKRTFLGLSGAGDLFLTASSVLSRNYRAGLLLAEGKNKDEIISELKEVVEGIPTAFAIEQMANKHEIYTPIVSEVAQILRGKSVKQSLKDLLS